MVLRQQQQGGMTMICYGTMGMAAAVQGGLRLMPSRLQHHPHPHLLCTHPVGLQLHQFLWQQPLQQRRLLLHLHRRQQHHMRLQVAAGQQLPALQLASSQRLRSPGLQRWRPSLQLQ